ncbi:unnamed protein product, partial [Ixodes persulcatus]
CRPNEETHQDTKMASGGPTIPSEEPDVVVCIRGSEFLAHKEILMAASPYLRDVLQGIGTEQKIKVELEGVSPSAFEALRSYMYLGSIRITCQNVTEVYRCAYKLRIRPLISKCLQYLAESGEVGRHVVLYVNAMKVGMRDEEKAAFQFLVEHFDSVIRCREFLDLNLNELQALLRSDVLGTSSELNVYVAALAWLDHDYERRRSIEEQVLDCVRFPLIDDQTLMRCFKPPLCPDAAVNAAVKLKMVKAVFTHLALLRDREDLAVEYRARPRTYLVEFPTVSWDKNGVLRNYEKCSYTRENQTIRHEAATCIQDAFRRHRGWPLKSTLPKLDSGTDVGDAGASYAEFVPTWVDSSESLSAKTRKDRSQEMEIDTSVYEAIPESVVLAQCYIRRYLARKRFRALHARIKPVVELENVMEEDDPYQHFLVRHPGSRSLPPITWDNFPARVLTKHSGPLQELNSSVVLLLGGVEPTKNHELGTSCTILRYNPRTRALARCGRLPQPRHNHTVAFLDGFLYVIGGFDTRNTHGAVKFATKTCFRMSVETRRWERLADMRHARCNHATVACNRKVYAIAGQDEFDRFLKSVEVYDPSEDTWTQSPVSLCCKMSACGATLHNGTVHIAGGVVQSKKRTDKVFLVSSVERWDSTFQRWLKEATVLPTGRGSMSLVSFQDQLLSVGGLTRDDDVQLSVCADVLSYNRKRNVWDALAPLPEPRHGAGVVNADDSLLLFGGLKNVSQTEASAQVLSYNHRQDLWEQVASLPCGLAGFAVVVLPPSGRNSASSKDWSVVS